MLDRLTASMSGRAWVGPVVALAAGALVAGTLNLGLAQWVAVPTVEGVDQAPVEAGQTDEGTEQSGSEPEDKPRRGVESVVAEARGAGEAARRRSEEDYLKGILGRNLFDPSQIGKEQLTLQEARRKELEAEEGGEAETELKISLTGTIVSRPAANSAAFIVEEGNSTAWAYGVGQKVQGAEIVEILEDRIRLQRNGRDEWLRMGADKPERQRTASAPAGRGSDGSSDGAVEQVDENEFVLDRDMVEKQLEDIESLSRMGRALLHRGPDGKYDGYRLSAIRRGSLPDEIGIRNGDIIHSINGIDMNSLEGAMQAYESLRNESKLEVNVTRRGRPEKLSYSIR